MISECALSLVCVYDEWVIRSPNNNCGKLIIYLDIMMYYYYFNNYNCSIYMLYTPQQSFFFSVSSRWINRYETMHDTYVYASHSPLHVSCVK